MTPLTDQQATPLRNVRGGNATTAMITIEQYLKKHYKQQSDRAIARLFCTTAYRIERLRLSLRLVREPRQEDVQPTLTDAERMAWYSGTFNPHEVECWITGGKPDSKFSRPPAPPPKRNANGQWSKRMRKTQVGSRAAVHPAILKMND